MRVLRKNKMDAKALKKGRKFVGIGLYKMIIVASMAVAMMLSGVCSVKAVEVDWGYQEDAQQCYVGRSVFGNVVIQETLHASGYVYATWGRVTDVWLTTERCNLLNEIVDETTWIAEYPGGEYAKGKFKVKFGVPSPWGTIGTSGTTRTLSITF